MLAVTVATSFAASAGETSVEFAPQYQSGGLLASVSRMRLRNA